MDKISLLYIWAIRLVLILFPDYPPLMRFRGFLYSFAMKECGKNFQVAADVKIMGANRLIVKNDVYIATGVVILARDIIEIHSEVLIGVNSVIASGNHTFEQAKNSYRFGEPMLKPINIGRGSWVASNVTVTAGTNIGKGVLIGPASNTYGQYDDYGIYLATKLIKKI
ncbi:MAG: acyltransferase [Psychrobacter sp.]